MRTFPLLPVSRGAGGSAVVTTPAKLNLFLEIDGRRADGYHDLTSLVIAVTLHDRIRVAPGGERDTLRIEGIPVTAGDDNLVLRALAAARRVQPIPPLAVTLEKSIPPGSGLGGGSGNAAGMLALLDALYPLGLGREPMLALAATLGSDVPFFLGSGAALVRGRGDMLSSAPEPLFGGDRPTFLLVLPEIASSTARAYGRVTFPLTSPDGPISFPTTTFVDLRLWVAGLFNRFERSVLLAEPVLERVASGLERVAPGRWRMTGSGSGFFVVCQGHADAESAAAELRPVAREWGVPLRTYTVTWLVPAGA